MWGIILFIGKVILSLFVLVLFGLIVGVIMFCRNRVRIITWNFMEANPNLWESVIIDKYAKVGDEFVWMGEVVRVKAITGDKFRRFELCEYPGITISYDLLRLQKKDRNNKTLKLNAEQYINDYKY